MNDGAEQTPGSEPMTGSPPLPRPDPPVDGASLLDTPDDWAPTLRLHVNWAARPESPVSPETPTDTSSAAQNPGRPMPEQIGPYQIQEVLARGGMGVVYKALDTRLNRVVAMKMVLSGQHADPAAYARFRSEAEVIARLQHPNIVQIYGVGEHEGLPYFALEYVDGPSLFKVLANGALPARQAAELTLALARAIEFAHQRGIVHRDLKPGNILLEGVKSHESVVKSQDPATPTSDSYLLTPDLTPKITDFGLAKLRGKNDTHTRPGEVVGTPNYMAPEQAEGNPAGVGPVADVYALGAVLYEMLTGQPPFDGTTPLETLMWVRLREPIPPTQFNRNLPRDLETICLKCLHKE
ncbi:MAG TPA: serine/threonine-protein kinase, partial [Gemmataceae bacterium]|nr:serine/threonine-protein kinase [Gemmataceae bacterium]